MVDNAPTTPACDTLEFLENLSVALRLQICLVREETDKQVLISPSGFADDVCILRKGRQRFSQAGPVSDLRLHLHYSEDGVRRNEDQVAVAKQYRLPIVVQEQVHLARAALKGDGKTPQRLYVRGKMPSEDRPQNGLFPLTVRLPVWRGNAEVPNPIFKCLQFPGQRFEVRPNVHVLHLSAPHNQDREEPRDSPPPTPPGIRITYHGGSVEMVL